MQISWRWSRSARAALLATVASALSASGFAQSSPELTRAAESVVAFARDGGPGAGLVVGRDADALVVLTAAHVLGPSGDEVRGLRARLKALPGTDLTQIRLLKVDRTLDLAAVRIEGLKGAGVDLCKQPILALNAELPVRREHAVFAVGNPAGVAWAVPPAPDHVSEVGARDLRFQSTVIDIGHSGGGLFNVFGDLVGMIRADQPPWGVALRVSVLVKALADWQLKVGPGACGGVPQAAAAVTAVGTGDTAFRRWLATITASRENFMGAVAPYRPTAASLAVYDNNVAELERLVKAGAELDEDRGVPPLHWAVALRRTEILRYLLLKGVRLNNYSDSRIPGVTSNSTGEAAGTALHMAARLDDADLTRLLVKAGADLSIGYNIDNSGSPLTIAATHNSLKAAKALLAAGADPTEERQGWSVMFPLLAALNEGNIQMAKLLRASGAKLVIRVGNVNASTLLSLAAEKAPLSSIRWLIEQKVAVNCPDAGCDSPMFVAVRANRVDVIQTLVKAGANPTGDKFQPYLNVAVSMDHMEALKALLLAGAKPDVGSWQGTPLSLARRDEKKEMVDALLAHGAKR